MRRWRRRRDDEDDLVEYDEDEDEEEEEEYERPKRRYPPPRPLRVTRFQDLPDEDEENDGPKFEELEAKIRAGEYKPKGEDPWTAHILYQNLKALGEI